MVTFTKNILEIAGDLQLSAGQRSRYKAVIHDISLILNEENCDVALMVDAGIAFKKLKCKVVLHSIRITSPLIAIC